MYKYNKCYILMIDFTVNKYRQCYISMIEFTVNKYRQYIELLSNVDLSPIYSTILFVTLEIMKIDFTVNNFPVNNYSHKCYLL